MSDPSFAVGVEVAVDEQLVGVSTSGRAHVHLSVGEDVFVEKEADPFQGEALRLVDGQRIGEADGELGAFVGERTALDRASVQRDEDFPWGGFHSH